MKYWPGLESWAGSCHLPILTITLIDPNNTKTQNKRFCKQVCFSWYVRGTYSKQGFKSIFNYKYIEDSYNVIDIDYGDILLCGL